jgi:hypothetical protein
MFVFSACSGDGSIRWSFSGNAAGSDYCGHQGRPFVGGWNASLLQEQTGGLSCALLQSFGSQSCELRLYSAS